MRKSLMMIALLACAFALILGCTALGEDDRVERASYVRINSTNFPDEYFRDYVSDYCDSNGDGKLSSTEIAAVKEIDLMYEGCESLKGVEYFTALEVLDVTENELTSLDVSKNVNLRDLGCAINSLARLDLTKNTKLESLSCSGNQLTSLDVSNNTQLEWLECQYNFLTSLDVTNNTQLTDLCFTSNEISSIDLSKCIALESLECGGNRLTQLNVTKLTKLTWLDCSENKLTSLDVSKCTKLEYLACPGNNIKSLNVVTCPNLVKAVMHGKYTNYGSYGCSYSWTNNDDIWYDLYFDEGTTITASIMSTPDFIIPAKATSIQAEAFMKAGMTVVVCPNTLKTIGARAFANCTALKQIYIPATTTAIADDAFSGCTGLTIYAPAGSAAAAFASDHDIKFISYVR